MFLHCNSKMSNFTHIRPPSQKSIIFVVDFLINFYYFALQHYGMFCNFNAIKYGRSAAAFSIAFNLNENLIAYGHIKSHIKS